MLLHQLHYANSCAAYKLHKWTVAFQPNSQRQRRCSSNLGASVQPRVTALDAPRAGRSCQACPQLLSSSVYHPSEGARMMGQVTAVVPCTNNSSEEGSFCVYSDRVRCCRRDHVSQ